MALPISCSILSRFCHTFVTTIYLPVGRKVLILQANEANTMKRAFHILLTACLAILAACTTPSAKYTPIEEQRIAHDYLAKARNISADDTEQRMTMYNKATYHFANIVVRPDANDTLRADALFTLRWIEAYISHNYELALQYLNQYMTLVGPEHESYPTCLAYKADDLWHFGAQDSAIHYANKALATPRQSDDGIGYTCHYILWNIYETLAVPDSANRHKALFLKIRESREFEPMTMDELRNKLETSIIAPDVKANTEVFGAFTDIRAKRLQEEMERKRQRQSGYAYLALLFFVLLLASVLLFKIVKRRRTRPTQPMQDSIVPPINTASTPSRLQQLDSALTEGRQAFEHTSAYSDILTMQVNEKELPNITYETTRQLGQSLLASFNTACRILIAQCELNDQEIICILGCYLGYSNTLIAHIGHTTTATIRKRKERIKKKLPADFCDIIFGSKG